MAARRLLPFLLLPALLLPSLPTEGQTGFLYAFSMDLPQERLEVPATGSREVTITFHDLSRDNTNLVGQPPAGVNPHHASFEVVPTKQVSGWIASQPGSLTTYGGQTKSTTFQVIVSSVAEDPYFTVEVRGTIQTPGGTYNLTGLVLFYTPGIAGFQLPYSTNIQSLGPRESGTASLRVQNTGSLVRSFSFALRENPCNLKVAAPPSVSIEGYKGVDVPFTVRGPDTRFDPLGLNSEYCRVVLDVWATDNPGLVKSNSVTARLSPGVAIDPMLVFWVLVAAAVLVLLVLLLRRRKEKVEEELLGKPQKPWTIPVEQVYLRELKARDPRAWYVVRHYLMEDEYRSALLWYKAYKKGTKGARKKEALILRQEKAYERWKARWAKAIAKPLQEADRYEAKLQRKLDRRARKAHRKALRSHRKEMARLQERHAKRVAAAKEAHAKAAAKAQRKGRPAPPAPQAEPLALPPKPEQKPVALASHRWAKKAARFRRRRVREQGNLEVKFERQDARYLAKLGRKVRRIARKLDDPNFVAEHPLLQEPAGAPPKAASRKAAKQ